MDGLANAYGWTADYILDRVYLDQAYKWLEMIERRRINNYKILLAISQNPHTKEPEKLWELFDRPSRTVQKASSDMDTGLDRSGFASLKMAMSGSHKIIVK